MGGHLTLFLDDVVLEGQWDNAALVVEASGKIFKKLVLKFQKKIFFENFEFFKGAYLKSGRSNQKVVNYKNVDLDLIYTINIYLGC